MITIEQYNEIQAYKEMGKTRTEVSTLTGISRKTVGLWWDKAYKGDHSTEWKKAHAELQRKSPKKEKVTSFTWSFAEAYNRG